MQVYVERTMKRRDTPWHAVAAVAGCRFVWCVSLHSYVISNDRLLQSVHSRSSIAAQYKVYRQSGAITSIALHANCCSNNCTM